MVDQPEINGRRAVRPDPDPTEATISLIEKSIGAFKENMLSRLDSIEKAALTFTESISRVPTALDKGLATARDYSDAQMTRVTEHADANYKINSQKFTTIDELRKQSVDRIIERLDAITNIVTANKVEADVYRELIAEQTRKNSTDVDAAVKAAFAASTLAVQQQNIANALASDKQGAAFTKDVDKLTVSLAQLAKSSDDKLEEVRRNYDQRVNDLKDRIGQIEARSGVSDPRTAQMLQDMNSSISRLTSGADTGTGRSQQSDAVLKTTLTVGGMLIALVAVLLTVFEIMKSSGAAGN